MALLLQLYLKLNMVLLNVASCRVSSSLMSSLLATFLIFGLETAAALLVESEQEETSCHAKEQAYEDNRYDGKGREPGQGVVRLLHDLLETSSFRHSIADA